MQHIDFYKNINSHIEVTQRNLRLNWIPPCRAHWLLHKPTVTQAHSMLCETPAKPCAGMTVV